MSIKYYNLKFRSKKVSGSILKVDTKKDKSGRLECLTNFETRFRPEFNFLRKEGEGEVYEAIYKPFKYDIGYSLMFNTGCAVTEPNGGPNHFEFLVGPRAELEIIKKPKYFRAYLGGISAKKAKEESDEACNYSMLLDYMCGM